MDRVKESLRDPTITTKEINYAFCLVVSNGHLELVELLLSDPRTDPSLAIIEACKQNNESIVRMLLEHPKIYPKARGLTLSYVDMVVLLLEHGKVDPLELIMELVNTTGMLHYFDEMWFDNERRLFKVLFENFNMDYQKLFNFFVSKQRYYYVEWILKHKSELLDLNGNPETVKLLIHANEDELVELLLTCDRFDPKDVKGSILYAEKTDLVSTMLENPNTKLTDADLRIAISRRNLKLVKLLTKRLRVTNYDFAYACKYSLPIVQFLLGFPDIDPTYDNNSALRKACEVHGNMKIVEFLLTACHVDPSIPDNEPIYIACRCGNLELVKLFLKNESVDPSSHDNRCIKKALERWELKTVKLLARDQRVNPTCYFEYCLQHSLFHEVKALLQHPKIVVTSEHLQFTMDLPHLKMVKLLLKNGRLFLTNYLTCGVTLIDRAVSTHVSWTRVYLYSKYGVRLRRYFRRVMERMMAPPNGLWYQKSLKHFNELNI